jgi:hypothetical protein
VSFYDLNNLLGSCSRCFRKPAARWTAGCTDKRHVSGDRRSPSGACQHSQRASCCWPTIIAARTMVIWSRISSGKMVSARGGSDDLGCRSLVQREAARIQGNIPCRRNRTRTSPSPHPRPPGERRASERSCSCGAARSAANGCSATPAIAVFLDGAPDRVRCCAGESPVGSAAGPGAPAPDPVGMGRAAAPC